MNLNLLPGFVAICDAGSLSAAARTLELSQPALSGQIQALERELGLRLFTRSARGMRPTAAGERLLEQARGVLQAAERLAATADELQRGVGPVLRLGIIDGGATLPLDRISARLEAEDPATVLDLHDAPSGRQLRLIQEGVVDAAVVEGPVPELGLRVVPVGSVPMRVILPRAWAAELTTAGLAELARRPWVFVSPECSYHALMERLAERHGLRLNQRFLAQDRACLDLVAHGLAITVFNQERLSEVPDPERIAIWPQFEERLPRSLVVREDRATEPGVERLVAACLEALAPGARRAG